jgi:hypothetical protein
MAGRLSRMNWKGRGSSHGYFKAISYHLLEETEENYKILVMTVWADIQNKGLTNIKEKCESLDQKYSV